MRSIPFVMHVWFPKQNSYTEQRLHPTSLLRLNLYDDRITSIIGRFLFSSEPPF